MNPRMTIASGCRRDYVCINAHIASPEEGTTRVQNSGDANGSCQGIHTFVDSMPVPAFCFSSVITNQTFHGGWLLAILNI